MARSKFEERTFSELAKANKTFKYEVQKFQYTITYNYIPDMVLPNGIYVELKGRFRQESQRKMRAFKELYPKIDLRFFFQKADLPVDGLKMTCAEYAKKNGFRYTEDMKELLRWFDE